MSFCQGESLGWPLQHHMFSREDRRTGKGRVMSEADGSGASTSQGSIRVAGSRQKPRGEEQTLPEEPLGILTVLTALFLAYSRGPHPHPKVTETRKEPGE